MQRVPVSVITGFLGVGKTTAIRHLLSGNRGDERWAVLVNEFGDVAIDGASLEQAGVAIREVPGGCICCAANMTLKVALTDLLRRVRPDRLLLEPTGLGHLGRILALLHNEELGQVLELRAVIAIADPEHFTAERLQGAPVYREQLELADIVALNKLDRADPARVAGLQAWLAGLYPPKLAVQEVDHARLPTEWLDWTSRIAASPPDQLISGIEAHHHTHPHGTVHEEVSAEGIRFSRVRAENESRSVCGWVFPRTVRFDEEVLSEVLIGIGTAGDDGVERAKGVVHCNSGWRLLNLSEGEVQGTPTAWQRDTRLECIGRPGARPAWRQIEAALLAARHGAGK